MKLLSAKEHHDLLEEADCSDVPLIEEHGKAWIRARAERPPMPARMSCTGLVLSLNLEAGS
jgi:hypothetical protein